MKKASLIVQAIRKDFTDSGKSFQKDMESIRTECVLSCLMKLLTRNTVRDGTGFPQSASEESESMLLI